MRAAPSITRLFAATLLAVALVGLVTQVATWRGAQATQGAMVELAQRIGRLHQARPSPAVRAQLDYLAERAADAGDAAVQAAVSASILFAAMLVVLGVGLWYNRRRLAAPFARVGTALDRVAGGAFDARLDEREAEEFGTIARGVNRMAAALASREQRLTALNAELDAALRTKDQFVANISHELRTPLNSIIGFTDLLLTQELGGAPLSDHQRDFLETVARNGRHLLFLINDLLDLQRAGAGRLELKPETVVLADLLTEAAGSVRAQAEQRHHTLEVTAPAPTLRVRADRARVRQVLLNFLSNAIKFTPDGGRIAVSAGPAGGKGGEGGVARVAVTDTGIGIAPEDQGKLFREFVQIDPSASRQYEGTGLGLALSRRLIELHGGETGLESALGQGSTFWFTLPRADA